MDQSLDRASTSKCALCICANEARPQFTFAANRGGKGLRGQFASERRGTEEAKRGKKSKGCIESNYTNEHSNLRAVFMILYSSRTHYKYLGVINQEIDASKVMLFICLIFQ